MSTLPSCVQLTHGQVLKVYGFFATSTLLSWSEVTDRSLSFRFLHRTACLTAAQLHRVQPSAAAWVESGLADLQDVPDMLLWPLNPVRDLHTPVDRLLGTPADTLAKSGATYQHLLDGGLTADVMPLFHFSLAEWQALGLTADHVRWMSEVQTRRLFGGAPGEVALEIERLTRA
eukprot:2325351-Rhodomonas_salina.2